MCLRTDIRRQTLKPDVFADFSETLSFSEMANKVCEAKSAFEDLSSDVRSRFKNDPSNLIDFVMDVDNALEAHEMGLLELDKASLEALKPKDDVKSSLTTETTDSEPVKADEPKANPTVTSSGNCWVRLRLIRLRRLRIGTF